ncbi:hypothetical protein D9615_004772, partial [Tricholomella constricta]
EMAGALDRYGARPAQVGIQFVQIGDDKGATAFLQKLDDDLAKLGVRAYIRRKGGLCLNARDKGKSFNLDISFEASRKRDLRNRPWIPALVS